MSSQDSKPLLVFKQDAMTGGYKLTYGRVKIRKEIFYDCLTNDFFSLQRIESKLNHIVNVYKFTGQYDIIKNEIIEERQKSINKINKQINYITEDLSQIKSSHKECKDPIEKKLLKDKFETLKNNKNELKHKLEEPFDIEEETKNAVIFNGHSLFSTLLPDDFEYVCDNGLSPDGKPVYVTRGVLISGTLSKEAIGNESGSLIHHLGKDYGYKVACDFISYYQLLINNWFLHFGYTVGIQDCIPKNTDLIQKEMNKCFLESSAIMRTEKDDELLEAKINGVLGKAATIGQKIAKDALDPINNLVSIIKSGAKGKFFNLTQVTSSVGQQNVNGQRISKIYGGRTLPHFKKISNLITEVDRLPFDKLDETNSDLLPILKNLFESRGFVVNSFYKGLTPTEFFFHACGGREGLIDTACKSVTYETLIMIIENDVPKVVQIGEWIDKQLDNKDNKNNIEYYKEDRNLELLNIDKVIIPTVDKLGNVSWADVTAITRHDPGNILYEVKTSAGKCVTVPASKSLLIWDPETKELISKLTEDVKVGECVPVTMNLCEPPITKDVVDMSVYLPKNKYVYGTEFNKAVKMMNENLDNKKINKDGFKKIEKGWWNKHNNSSFILPYPNKARLQRVTVRSKVQNIKEGYIYPYDANREDRLIPEYFNLNEENGIFIGLFLADGYTDGNSIRITKENPTIIKFIQNWFDKHLIKHSIEKKVIEENIIKDNKMVPAGTSTTIKGSSTILSTFLLQFVGNTSYHKYVPNEAYTAPIEFIKGLLNGYFSGDGCVYEDCIFANSTSSKLIDGISMLCSRLGVFCKITKRQQTKNNLGTENIAPTYNLNIRAQWAKLFSEKINLIHPEKNIKLKTIKPSNNHRNYESHNDIVLDKIVEINKIGVEKHPKLYDLTVPKTINFSIHSGLHLLDTASTGYVQRKMIKMVEDLKVDYRNVISTSNDSIVEFHYGEDNMDASRLIRTKQGLSFVDINHVVEKLNKNIEFDNFKKDPSVL